MPYRILTCVTCDMAVYDAGPHGPEDEYCEGEEGFEYIDVFTLHEIARRLEDAIPDLKVTVR